MKAMQNQNFNSLNNLVPNIWNSLRIFWAPKSLGSSTSPSLSLSASITPLIDTGQFHITEDSVCGDCLCVSKMLRSPGAIPSQVASWPLIRNSTSTTWCQASTVLQDPFNPTAFMLAKPLPGKC